MDERYQRPFDNQNDHWTKRPNQDDGHHPFTRRNDDESARAGHKPFHKADRPFEGTDRPFRGEGRSFRNDGRSFRNDERPFRDDRKPFHGDDRPFRGEGHPFKDDRKPFRGEGRPFRNDGRSFRNDERPFRDDRKPFRGDDRPFRGESRPFKDDRKPFRGEGRPFRNDGRSFRNDEHPFKDDRKPFPGDDHPFRGESRPFKDDRKPFRGEGRPFRNDSGRSFKNDMSLGDRASMFHPGGPFDDTATGRDDRPKMPKRDVSLGHVYDIDQDILRMIARRVRLLAKMPETGRASRERDLRTHWESEASKISRDPKMIRQMFSLLQEVEISEGEFGGEAFNLAPGSIPSKVDLALPACCRQTRMFITLATASGQPFTMKGVTLNAPLLECAKCMNQLGGDVHWDEYPDPVCVANATKSATGARLPVLDRIIHVGDNPFNLFLVIFMLVTRQARVKLVGESSLRFTSLNVLKHFLPILGCRLSGLVPGQDGLPARLESAAILPDNVQVPADLPVDAVTAMLLLSPFWGHKVTFDLRAHRDAKDILTEVTVVLSQVGAVFTTEDGVLTIDSVPIAMKDDIPAEMTPPLTYPLLALPAFTGGETVLHGNWPRTFPGNQAVMDMLGSVVLLDIKDGECTARPSETAPAEWNFSSLPQSMLGIALALFMNALVKGQAKPMLPALPDGTDMSVVEDFIAHLGYTLNHGSLSEGSPSLSAFAAPTAWWGIGFALAAFVRQHLKLANPSMVSIIGPQFWTIYNSLPEPVLARPFEQPLPKSDTTPKHRRIHSNEFLSEEDLPPALDNLDDDD